MRPSIDGDPYPPSLLCADDPSVESDIGLTALLHAFPFSFSVNAEGRISVLGHFFETRYPALLNEPVSKGFALANAFYQIDDGNDLTFGVAPELMGRRVELLFQPPPAGEWEVDQGDASASPPPLRLAGAFLAWGVGGASLFLGTVAPADIRNMTALGLSVSDFGPIDPSPEFAMMAEVNAGMLADSQMLNRQLRASRDEAVAAQQALEQHREQLEELVADRTVVIQQQAADLELALQQERKLSAMQRSFVSMASHEFRTPLAIIDGNAQKIGRRFERMSAEDVAAGLEKIRSAVKRMTSLMESTLAAAKAEDGRIAIDPKPVDIQALLLDCCKVQNELSAHHQIMVDHDCLPDVVIADAGSVTQIITNLLSNAVKYSPEADRVDVRGWQEGDSFLISVQDFGLGIDTEEQDQMFTRFFRAKTSVGIPGTGIGLNLAQMLAREHGGSIELQSEKRKGSIFTLKMSIDCSAR